MAQTTTGVRAVLNHSSIYNFTQNALGAGRLRKQLVRLYVRPWEGISIIDIGCGTGRILDYLPSAKYYGIDISYKYIQSAIKRYGALGEFHVGRAETTSWPTDRHFDVVLLVGVLHHLGDDEVLTLFQSLKPIIGNDTRVVTADPCFAPGQSPIAKWLAGQDRGRNVRTEQQYRLLFREHFNNIESHVRHDLLNIPYTHCIIETGRVREALS